MPPTGSTPDLAAMSKRRIGWYEDGSFKYSYFRRFKHYRIKRNGFRMIRWKMYVAMAIKLNKAFDMMEIRSKQFTNK